MTARQEAHLARIKIAFDLEVDAKYRAGAVEHDGDLMDMDSLALVNEAMQESVDKYTYLFTLRERILAARGRTGG